MMTGVFSTLIGILEDKIMIIHVVQTQDGRIISAFISDEKAQKLADSDINYTVESVHVQDAQDNPVRG